eukprot:2729374-Alexandrium_andersonii.AAC.1
MEPDGPARVIQRAHCCRSRRRLRWSCPLPCLGLPALRCYCGRPAGLPRTAALGGSMGCRRRPQ